MDITLWLPVLGIVASLLASAVKQWNWSSDTRTTVAYLISGLLGVLAVWYIGAWDWANFLTTIGVVVGYQQAFYAIISRPLGLDKALTYNVINIAGDQNNAAQNVYKNNDNVQV